MTLWDYAIARVAKQRSDQVLRGWQHSAGVPKMSDADKRNAAYVFARVLEMPFDLADIPHRRRIETANNILQKLAGV